MPSKNQEHYTISGDKLMATIKKLVREGNARKIIIKNEEGKTFLEFPLTIGAVGVLAAPVVAAVGALAALVNKCTIVVERKQDSDSNSKKTRRNTSKKV